MKPFQILDSSTGLLLKKTGEQNVVQQYEYVNNDKPYEYILPVITKVYMERIV